MILSNALSSWKRILIWPSFLKIPRTFLSYNSTLKYYHYGCYQVATAKTEMVENERAYLSLIGIINFAYLVIIAIANNSLNFQRNMSFS